MDILNRLFFKYSQNENGINPTNADTKNSTFIEPLKLSSEDERFSIIFAHNFQSMSER